MRKLLIFLIKIYQVAISPIFGSKCRFYPSCSHYTKEAITSLPLHLALFYSLKRISKCHPFHKGGYDPVPKN
ncbi:membrane protein insertion efficiency factor YidD [Halobacteriovorax sp. JY17]|uniref:membrane protein insertion efficiency factor YidD n=1 Tax=Halobacteriovorax sp. JY17 TaxID=2014617 RepID=UPI000C43BFCD|nr:membrane protein insertion efficiency factor YidD [Halobacteriovorax sp. JY17]PIK16617.1 MAG: membrane protein insertion efficiency factor YidD [Halobacteriovorax sp. JY17]